MFSLILTIKISIMKCYNLRYIMRNPTLWYATRSDTHQTVQVQKMAIGCKFWMLEEEEL